MKHVLIVEDMPDHAYILQKQLTSLNFLSSVCIDPFTILRQIKEKVVDAVTVDISMPKQSGIDIIRYIREIDKNILIVVVTASSNDYIRFECMKAGANYYLTKPHTLSDLQRIFNNNWSWDDPKRAN